MKPKNYYIKIKFLFLVICCLWLFPLGIQAATLFLKPQSQTISQGDSFIVEVILDTEDEEVNTVGTNLIFPSDLLEVINLSKGGSILTLWVKEPSFSEENKLIQFQGGVPGGFGGEGLIGKVFLKAKKLGTAKINFSSDSQVLLHDGRGTPAQLTLLEGNYEIVKEVEKILLVTSKSHPDSNKWYRETTLYLHWKLEEGVEYSWILSHAPEAEPDEIPDEPEPKEGFVWMGAMEYEDLKDGIYYFHLKQKSPAEDWSDKVTLRAMIDSTPPESFKPEIGQDSAVFGGKYFLNFATADETSGVDHYAVSEIERRSFIRRLMEEEEKKEWKAAKSPYLLEDQSLGSKIFLKAVDEAGNEQIAEVTPPYKIIWEDLVFLAILVLIIIGTIWWLIRKLTKTRK